MGWGGAVGEGGFRAGTARARTFQQQEAEREGWSRGSTDACQAWGCRFAPRTTARQGRGCRKAGRPGPACWAASRRQPRDPRPPDATPCPPQGSYRAGGGKAHQMHEARAVGVEGPSQGGSSGGFRRRGVQAPPAEQVQQRRGRPAAAPGGDPDLVTNDRARGEPPTPLHSRPCTEAAAEREQRGARPAINVSFSCSRPPPSLGAEPLPADASPTPQGAKQAAAGGTVGGGTPGLLSDSGLRPPGRAGPRTQCRTQACGRGPCCWRPLRPGLSTPGANPPKGPRPFWPQGWTGRAPSPPGAPTAAAQGTRSLHL